MLRVLFTIALPLVLPTALYLVWIRVARWSSGGSPAEFQPAATVRWTALPWVWLAAAGAALLALVLFVVTVHFGTSQPGTYVPPRWENGRIVPAHIEPLHNQ
ncbi:MAG TPA: hypothetical protein VGS13_08215 [Stellaceae bacterium]|nr:hypothetical protein [Stellaceae bacterium]